MYLPSGEIAALDMLPVAVSLPMLGLWKCRNGSLVPASLYSNKAASRRTARLTAETIHAAGREDARFGINSPPVTGEDIVEAASPASRPVYFSADSRFSVIAKEREVG